MIQCFLLQERMAGDVKLYNEIIQHETLRVAVCDMLDGGCGCPDTLRFWISSNCVCMCIKYNFVIPLFKKSTGLYLC